MSGRIAFAPYRIPPGGLPEEAVRIAADWAAEPLLARLDDPLPAALLPGAFAEIPSGLALAPEEACRGADGDPSGAPGAARACLNSDRHRSRVEASVRRALELGYAGVLLDRPDASLALGVLGAGFCAECQRAFSKELSREYGDQFQPLDFLAMAREALATSAGAVTHERLAFGREFWRARSIWLERSVAAQVRAARDAARTAGRSFEVALRFEAVGPAQLRAARHADAALFPVSAGGPGNQAGAFRLLRAAQGRRPCAAEVGGGSPERLAAVAATAAVEVVAAGAASPGLAATRRFLRAAAAHGRSAARAEPVAECAVLYSAESDLWTAGDHRAEVEWAGDALAGLQIQAPVVLRPADAPPGAVLVLAGARALSPLEAQEIRRRLEAGGGVLAVGEPAGVDEVGRPAPLPFPGGRPSGLKVGKGTLVQIPRNRAGEELPRALQSLLGRGRRAASTSGRAPLLVSLYRDGDRVDAHLATLGPGPSQGTTLFLGLQVSGEARRSRFKSSAGADERVPMNPSAYAISTVLPSFEGYAVLSLPG